MYIYVQCGKMDYSFIWGTEGKSILCSLLGFNLNLYELNELSSNLIISIHWNN